MILDGLERRVVRSFDGTDITYQIGGAGERVVVIANGLGSTFSSWRHVVAAFRDRVRVLIWDYRGLFDSGPIQDRDHVRIEDHCEDLRAILDYEGIDDAIVLGWSMGVQVALEFYHLYAERCVGLVLINGAWGHVYSSFFVTRVLPQLARPAVSLLSLGSPLLQKTVNFAVTRDWTFELAALLGLIDASIADIKLAAREFVDLDWKTYLTFANHLDDHDASHMLADVEVPVLVTAGREDVITPWTVGRGIAESIPNAEFFAVPHGTHFALLEFPEIMNLRLEKWFRDHFDVP